MNVKITLEKCYNELVAKKIKIIKWVKRIQFKKSLAQVFSAVIITSPHTLPLISPSVSFHDSCFRFILQASRWYHGAWPFIFILQTSMISWRLTLHIYSPSFPMSCCTASFHISQLKRQLDLLLSPRDGNISTTKFPILLST